MNKLTGFLAAMVFAISFSNVYAQDHSQHQSAAATAGTDPMAHLESDIDEIRNTKDASKRKELLTHHLQMMQEQIQALTATEHAAGGDMQGMDHGAMMQHHEKMVKLLQHMLETQEQILGLIETK